MPRTKTGKGAGGAGSIRKITTTKRFGVVDEAGDLCYYDNDLFEIVKDE